MKLKAASLRYSSLHCHACEGSEITAAGAPVNNVLLQIISIKGPSHQSLTPFISAQNIAIIGCLRLGRASLRFQVIKAGMLPCDEALLSGRWRTYLSPTSVASALHRQVSPAPIKSKGQCVSQRRINQRSSLRKGMGSDETRAGELLPQQRETLTNCHSGCIKQREAPCPASSSSPPSASASLSFQISFNPTMHLVAFSPRLPLHPDTFFFFFSCFFQSGGNKCMRFQRLISLPRTVELNT